MITKTVNVTIEVEVTVDETKFTEEFLREFRETMYQFNDLDDHIKHLAQLSARGLCQLSKYDPGERVEGYGPIGDMGISAQVTEQDEEVF